MNIFKWVQELVDQIIKQVMAQINIINDRVTQPIRGMITEVTGGIWKGDGATKFVNEMTSSVIPMLANIMGFSTNWANAIKKAQDTMNQAVQQSTSIAQGLFDVFNGIF
ncbi:MAG: hypothetical protein C0410_06210 [Anaerolinea sp.]|nr:hypothetical protein [Anaerolinea sp.]